MARIRAISRAGADIPRQASSSAWLSSSGRSSGSSAEPRSPRRTSSSLKYGLPRDFSIDLLHQPWLRWPAQQLGDLVAGGVLVQARQHQLLGAGQPADVAQPVLELSLTAASSRWVVTSASRWWPNPATR